MVVQAERLFVVRLELLGPQHEVLQASMLLSALRECIADTFGDFGAGCVQHSLQVKHFRAAVGCFIVRVARAHAALVQSAICMVCSVRKQRVRLTVLRTAGSARTARQYLEQQCRGQSSSADNAKRRSRKREEPVAVR